METTYINNKLYAKRVDLHEFEGNLNVITNENYQKLRQARYDYVDTDPLLVMPDGTILAGNHRKKADDELNQREMEWVEVIDFQQMEDSRWYVLQDTEIRRDKRSFATKEAAMMAYCLLRNSQYAGISPDKLANITGVELFSELDMNEFNQMVGEPKSIQEFIEKVASESVEIPVDPQTEETLGGTDGSEEAQDDTTGQEEKPKKEPKERKADEQGEYMEVAAKCPDCNAKFFVKVYKSS